eukprot:6263488-Amphidinium_carterae.2
MQQDKYGSISHRTHKTDNLDGRLSIRSAGLQLVVVAQRARMVALVMHSTRVVFNVGSLKALQLVPTAAAC